MRNILFLIIMLYVLFLPSAAFAEESVHSKTVTVNLGNKTREVTMVTVDLSDTTIRLEAVLANNEIKSAAELKDIAAQAKTDTKEPIAAINGTFFNAYSDNQPLGALLIKGKQLSLTTTGATIGFTDDNKVFMDSVSMYVTGFINGSSEWPNNWTVWSINNLYPDSSSADMLFTSEYGKTTGRHNKTSVIVENGIVVQKKDGEARIPDNGFTLVFGTKDYINKFKVGDTASYRVDYHHLDLSKPNSKGEELKWSNLYGALSAGPSLIVDGSVTANPIKEGQPDPKLTTNSADRSIVGVTAENVLIMATVPDVTVSELATIAKSLNLTDAINLDGGASSGLYYKGDYLTAPGRNLNNALVVTKSAGSFGTPTHAPVAQPIKIISGGKEITFTDQKPIIENGRVLVPLRGVFENLGATVSWEPVTKSAIILNGGKILNITENSDTMKIQTRDKNGVLLNNSSVKLDVVPRIMNGRLMIPLRAVGEGIDADVHWDNENRVVTLKK